jgi:hypothetical protein
MLVVELRLKPSRLTPQEVKSWVAGLDNNNIGSDISQKGAINVNIIYAIHARGAIFFATSHKNNKKNDVANNTTRVSGRKLELPTKSIFD